MKILITFANVDTPDYAVPVIIDEDDITASTDWARLFFLGREQLKHIYG